MGGAERDHVSDLIFREGLISHPAHRPLEGIKEARKYTVFPRSDHGLPWDFKWVQLNHRGSLRVLG